MHDASCLGSLVSRDDHRSVRGVNFPNLCDGPGGLSSIGPETPEFLEGAGVKEVEHSRLRIGSIPTMPESFGYTSSRLRCAGVLGACRRYWRGSF